MLSAPLFSASRCRLASVSRAFFSFSRVNIVGSRRKLHVDRAPTPSKVIILPGGLVSPLAYAPLARTMAQKGYSSFVVRFDFDLGERQIPYCYIITYYVRWHNKRYDSSKVYFIPGTCFKKWVTATFLRNTGGPRSRATFDFRPYFFLYPFFFYFFRLISPELTVFAGKPGFRFRTNKQEQTRTQKPCLPTSIGLFKEKSECT